LIENGTRRIKILEEMAQMIYREWFVSFRFPSGEKIRMAKSELGEIPKDWRVERLDKLARITMGQSPPSEYYNTEGKGLPFHQGVTDFGELFPENRMYCVLEQRIAEAGDILLSVRAPVGRMNITLSKIVIGRGLCALRSLLGWQPLLFQQLRDRFHEEDTMGSGTIFKAVTKEDICGLRFLCPEANIGGRFTELIGPMFEELEVLNAQISNLRQTRDLLLPKLISGQVSVEHLETKIAAQVS
jgi:type I restriction enzyme S subunit